MWLCDYTGMRSRAVILWQAYGFMILAQCERRNGKKVTNKIPTATNDCFGAVFHRKQATNRKNCAVFACKIVVTGRALSLLENDVWDVVSLQTTYLQR